MADKVTVKALLEKLQEKYPGQDPHALLRTLLQAKPELLEKIQTSEPRTTTKPETGYVEDFQHSMEGVRDRAADRMMKRAADPSTVGKAPVKAGDFLTHLGAGMGARTAETIRGAATPKNAALAATGMAVPAARLPIAAYYGVSGMKDMFTGPQSGEQPEDTMQRQMQGGATVAGAGAGAIEGVKDFKMPGRSPAAMGEKAASVLEEGSGALNARKAEFHDSITRLIDRKYWQDIASKYDIKGGNFGGKSTKGMVPKAYRAVQQYANDFFETNMKDRVAKYPGQNISGAAIQKRVMQSLSKDTLARPQDMKIVAKMLEPLSQDIPLDRALDELKRANKTQQGKRLVTVRDTVNKAIGDAVRNEMYDTLGRLGETDIPEIQKDYQAMARVRDTLQRNIPASYKAGKGPGMLETVARHPVKAAGVAAGLVGGSGFESSGLEAAGAVAGGSLLADYMMKRRTTPNARVARSFNYAGKNPGATPSFSGGFNPKALLGPGPIPLGSSMNPIQPPGPPSFTKRPLGGLLGPGTTPLGSAMQPVGTPGPPSFSSQPLSNLPAGSVRPGEIKPAPTTNAPPGELLPPDPLFSLFQTKGSKSVPIRGAKGRMRPASSAYKPEGEE